VISQKDFKKACVKKLYMEVDDKFEGFLEYLLVEDDVSL